MAETDLHRQDMVDTLKRWRIITPPIPMFMSRATCSCSTSEVIGASTLLQTRSWFSECASCHPGITTYSGKNRGLRMS